MVALWSIVLELLVVQPSLVFQGVSLLKEPSLVLIVILCCHLCTEEAGSSVTIQEVNVEQIINTMTFTWRTRSRESKATTHPVGFSPKFPLNLCNFLGYNFIIKGLPHRPFPSTNLPNCSYFFRYSTSLENPYNSNT